MNVAVIGAFPKQGAMSYGSLSYWIVNSWEFLGHEVTQYDRSEILNMRKDHQINFFVDCSEDYSNDIPNDLQGVKVTWQLDVQMPMGTERAVNIARKMDYTFCTNMDYGVKLLEKFGIESTWVPYGYDHVLQRDVSSLEVYVLDGHAVKLNSYDVMMIGNANSPERVQLWNLLSEKYKERAFVGTINDRHEYLKGKAGSYICISQPTEPFNTIINLRVWNALACGKLLLCKRPTIKEHELLGLIDGKNVVYWDTFEDLIEKCDYYIEHKEEGDKIAQEGLKLGNKYLMPNQIRIIEQILYSKFYDRLT